MVTKTYPGKMNQNSIMHKLIKGERGNTLAYKISIERIIRYDKLTASLIDTTYRPP